MSAARRPPPSAAWSLVCLLWLALARGASGGLQPALKLDSTGQAVRTVNYTEGSLPLALSSNLTLLAADSGSPCITAVVRIPRAARARGCKPDAAVAQVQITNPVNAPLETLAVAADYMPDVTLTYTPNTGQLTLSSAAIVGCVPCCRRRAARRASFLLNVWALYLYLRSVGGKDPTAALALALSHVTYQLASANPDSSPRAVTFLVTDAAGSSSRPTVAVVNIIRAWFGLLAPALCEVLTQRSAPQP